MSRTINRRSRRSRDDDQYEEEPTRGRRSRDADEYEEDPPRRGRRSRDADDEDEAPKSRRRARSESDDYEEAESPRAGRRSRGDDEDNDRSRSRGDEVRRGGSGSRGWKSFKDKRSEHASSDYVKNWKYPEEESLVKILDEEPFAIYTEHWIDELKKKSYGCLTDLDEKCPLCAIGDKPKVYAFFNLLDLSSGSPKVWPWKVSSSTMDQLDRYATSNKTSPINRDDVYWSIWKSGGGRAGRVQVHVQPVKERDLGDDWDTDPLEPEELDEFPLFTAEDVTEYLTKRDLQRIADELD